MAQILLRRKSGSARRSMSDLLLLMGFIVVPLSLCVGELVTPALADFLDHCPKGVFANHFSIFWFLSLNFHFVSVSETEIS